MEGLRQRAISTFVTSQAPFFYDTSSEFSLHEVWQDADSNDASVQISLHEAMVPKSDILSRFLNPRTDEPGHQAPLIQIVILGTANYGICTSQNLFLDLFHACRLEPVLLHSLDTSMRTALTVYQRSDSPFSAAEDSSNVLQSHLLYARGFSMLWSTNPSLRLTRAILLAWDDTVENWKEELSACLRVHKHLSDKECFMQFVASIQAARGLRNRSFVFYNGICQAELVSKHGLWNFKEQGDAQQQSRDLKKLLKTSEEVGQLGQLLEYNEKEAEVVLDMLRPYIQEATMSLVTKGEKPSGKHEGEDKAVELDFMMAMKTMWSLISENKDNVALLRQRARTQSSILLNLISQAHAESSVELARLTRVDNTNMQKLSESSVEIAGLTRRDSGAMKMLALMTTIFLPGTFFAALFSVPSLQWTAKDGESVATGRFWVYWVFAVPSTLALLGVYRWWVVRKYSEPGRVKTEEGKGEKMC